MIISIFADEETEAQGGYSVRGVMEPDSNYDGEIAMAVFFLFCLLSDCHTSNQMKMEGFPTVSRYPCSS